MHFLFKEKFSEVPEEQGSSSERASEFGTILVPFAGRYVAQSPSDLRNANVVSTFIRNNPDAFERDKSFGHVTGSSFVIDGSRSHVLLTHHAKLDTWLPLGGHCDGIRDARFVALKEAYEESGLRHLKMLKDDIFDIDIHEIPVSRDIPAHVHFDIRYVIEADIAESLKMSRESKELRWVHLSELETYTSKPSVLILKKKLGGL